MDGECNIRWEPFHLYLPVFQKSIEEGTDYYSVNDTRARNVAFLPMVLIPFKANTPSTEPSVMKEPTNWGKARKSRWLPTWNIAAA